MFPYFYSHELGYLLDYAEDKNFFEDIIETDLQYPVTFCPFLKELIIYNVLQGHFSWIREDELTSPERLEGYLYPEICRHLRPEFVNTDYALPPNLWAHLPLRDSVRDLMSQSKYLKDINELVKGEDLGPDRYSADSYPERIFLSYIDVLIGVNREFDLYPHFIQTRSGCEVIGLSLFTKDKEFNGFLNTLRDQVTEDISLVIIGKKDPLLPPIEQRRIRIGNTRIELIIWRPESEIIFVDSAPAPRPRRGRSS